MGENEISRIVVDSAVTLHKELGPGLLELVYEVVLAHELGERGLHVERQVPVELVYRGVRFDEAFRLDLKVQSKVIVEIKCVSRVTDVHKKQLLTYLRMTGCRLGLLLNFGETLMKKGTLRIVNNLDDTI